MILYRVDNEAYHRRLIADARLKAKGFPVMLLPSDGLKKRAQKTFTLHERLKQNGKQPPRFPRVVTENTLARYRGALLKRGLL